MLYVLLLLATPETAPCAEEAIKRSLPLEQVVFKDTQIIHIHIHIYTYTKGFQAQFDPTDFPYVYSQIEKYGKGAKRFNQMSDRIVLFYCCEEDMVSFNKLFVCCMKDKRCLRQSTFQWFVLAEILLYVKKKTSRYL